MDVKDIPRVIKEAFYLARTGRPGEQLPRWAALACKGRTGFRCDGVSSCWLLFCNAVKQ